MREIHEYKKKKVIKVFLAGASYDEIVQEVGIAKGTVVNIINDFQEGRMTLPLESAEYVNVLRKVAVDLRKNNTNVNQLTCYLKIHNKIQELGVTTEDIDDCLEVSKELASAESDNRFMQTALELARIRKEKGVGYTELLEDYKDKLEMLESVKEEISESKIELKKLRADEEQARLKIENIKNNLAEVQRNCNKQEQELKQGLERYLKVNKLSWERIRKIEAVVDSTFSATGLTKEAIQEIRGRIISTGSLLKTIAELKETKRVLEEQAEFMVVHHEHAYDELAQLIREREQAELSVKHAKREITKLNDEVESKKIEISHLDKTIHNNRERIYTADLIITFLFAKTGLNEYKLDKLVDMFISLRKIRLRIGPRIITDANDNVICKCEVPTALGGSDLQGLDENKIREALAYAIAPFVQDKFVPRILHDIAVTGRETTEQIAEVRRMVEKITGGSNT